MSLILALALGLAGCSAGANLPAATPGPALQPLLAQDLSTAQPSPPATAMPAAAVTPTPIKLVLWHALPEGGPAARLLREMAGRFHNQHPLLTVEPVYVGSPEEVYRKGLAALQAGRPPDLAVTGGSYIAKLMGAKAIVPLGPYAGDPQTGLTLGDKEDIFSGYWEACSYPEFAGSILSLPFTSNAPAMYYNLGLLKAAGIRAAPATWEDLETAVKAVSRGEVKGLAYTRSALTFDALLYSRGAEQLDGDPLRAVFNGQEGLDTLDLLSRLVEIGAALEPESSAVAQALFAAGKLALTFDSTANLGGYAEAVKKAGKNPEWGCTLLPQENPSRPRLAMDNTGICIFRTDEVRQQAAWQFIKWFADTDQVVEWGKLGYLPLRQSAAQKLAGTGTPAPSPQLKQIYDTVAPHCYPEPNVESEQEIRTFIEDAWAAVVADLKTPKQALDEAAARANGVLARR